MRRNRMSIVLLVIVTVLAMATTALAGKPDNPGEPPDHPNDPPDPHEMWTCAARVDNGAIWLPGRSEGDSYVSDVRDPKMQVRVDVPLCIDMPDDRTETSWLVEWEGTAVRKAPKGLMFIFEEVLPGTHYAEAEALPDPEAEVFLGCIVDDETGDYTCDGSWENITLKGNGEAKHLVFLAMGHQGDKWTKLTFKVTPDL